MLRLRHVEKEPQGTELGDREWGKAGFRGLGLGLGTVRGRDVSKERKQQVGCSKLGMSSLKVQKGHLWLCRDTKWRRLTDGLREREELPQGSRFP